jgi:hypothetical protein
VLIAASIYIEPNPIVIEDEAQDQVLVMEYNGDMWPDLFGVRASDGQRVFWVNNGERNSLNFTT